MRYIARPIAGREPLPKCLVISATQQVLGGTHGLEFVVALTHRCQTLSQQTCPTPEIGLRTTFKAFVTIGEYYEKQDGCCSGIGAHSFVVVLAHGSVIQFDTPTQKASRAESLKLGS